jgi:hypothetical protein
VARFQIGKTVTTRAADFLPTYNLSVQINQNYVVSIRLDGDLAFVNRHVSIQNIAASGLSQQSPGDWSGTENHQDD